MKKNLFKTMIILIIVTMAMAACTKAPVATEVPVVTEAAATEVVATEAPVSGEITVLFHRTDMDADGSLAALTEEFNAIYPDITVNWETITDYNGEVQTRMNTTDYGDVFLLPSALTPDKMANFCVSLGTVAEMGEKYNFINEAAYDGNVYGLAITGNGQGILYNKDVWAAAGITKMPVTPDEFLADLKLINDNTDAIPLYTNYAAGWALTQWDSQIESVSGDPDFKNITFVHTDAPFAEGMPSYVIYKILYDAVKEGYTEEDPTTTDWEASKTMIANGEIATMALGSWAISQMQAAAVTAGKEASVIGYMPFPTNIDGKQYAGAGGDYKLGININSENQAAARLFLDWFIDESNYAFDNGGIPPMKSADLPSQYADFATSGVEWVVDTAAIAGEEGLYNSIDNEAEIGFSNGSGDWQKRIIDSARSQSTETFDDIMNEANTKWAAARLTLGIE